MHSILVVDDDSSLRKMIAWALRAEGFIVQVASDGSEALGIWEHERPALIVLDLQMPVMDGQTFFRAIDGPERPPVIVVSAFNAERTGRELGAEGSIAKPFDPTELSALVTQLLPVP